MYHIEHRPAAKTGYHTPAQAKAYYGKYSRSALTVHWWDSPHKISDKDHDTIVNYILGKAAKGTGSVNYVLSNTKITELVAPENVAWASQSGNPISISIEFSPHLNDEGYRKAGWLINELDKRFGTTLALYPHHKFYPTQCPGSLNMTRMRNEANKWKAGKAAPAQGDTEMIKNLDAARKAYFTLRGSRKVTDAELNATAGKRSYEEFHNTGQAEAKAHDDYRKQLEKQVKDLDAKVNTLAGQVKTISQTAAQVQVERDEALKTNKQLIEQLKELQDKPPEVVKIIEECEVKPTEPAAPAKPKKPLWLKLLSFLIKPSTPNNQ